MKKAFAIFSSISFITIIIVSSILYVTVFQDSDNNEEYYPIYSDFSFDEPYINQIHPSLLTVNEWLEDLYYFMHMVKENYPFLWVRERTHGYN